VIYTVYRVTGKREYRGHKPGSQFEAILDPGPEQRAIARGDITVIARVEPCLEAGSFSFPDGWLPTDTAQSDGAATSADRNAGKG